MKITLNHYQQKATPRGLALIMTIIILALVTVMVLGFADLVRNETVSSGAHVERAQSQAFAEMGVDIVVGTLREHTANPDKVWATQPGALIVATNNNPSKLSSEIPLHSGMPSATTLGLDMSDPFAPANLNVQTINDPATHVISDQRVDPDNPNSAVVTLPLRWVYVRQDGELDFNELPSATNAENPLVGRVAWWVDDESSKVNINTAWKRNPATGGTSISNPFSPSHVTSVNLGSVFTSVGIEKERAIEMADAIHTHVTPGAPPFANNEKFDYTKVARFFNSTRELRELGGDYLQAFNASKFELTHYNHDPDTTFFNEPRVVLTTQKNRANDRPFLDILTTDNSDPGLVSGISFSKLNTTVKKLISYLQRTDWPVADEGKSIQSKYYGTTRTDRLAQIAINIIDYVRSAESARDIVEPIRGIMKGEDFVSTMQQGDLAGQNLTYKGMARSLFITEVGGWVSDTAESRGVNAGRYRVRLYVELHLLPNFGIELINFGGNDEIGTGMDDRNLYVYTPFTGTGNNKGTEGEYISGYFDAEGKPMHNRLHRVYQDSIIGKNPILKEGQYVTAVFEAFKISNTKPVDVTQRYALVFKTDKTAIAADGGWRCEVTPVSTGSPYTFTSGISYAPVEEQVMQIPSLETADPLMNVVKADYKSAGSGSVNSFGRRNYRAESALGKASGYPPAIMEQDTDEDDKVTDISLRMPYPKGHARNPEGCVYSPGELGFIHTGVEMDATKTSGGVGWRTLRLQPYKRYTKTGEVPDWAFMDLFTVPVTVNNRAQSIFGPHGGTAGRINMNAQAQPYGNPNVVSSPLERRQAIAALLMDVYAKEPTTTDLEGERLTDAQVASIAKSIYFKEWKSGPKYGYADAYDSPGEVVEIKNVADRGEESEAVVRGIANLISTRGGVYTVNSIGQSLQQTRNGQIVVTGETRQQTMLERYNVPSSVPGNPDEIRFNRLRYQPITP